MIEWLMDKLNVCFRIIPLSCGRLVALADVTVFLLADEKSAAEKKKKGGNVIGQRSLFKHIITMCWQNAVELEYILAIGNKLNPEMCVA